MGVPRCAGCGREVTGVGASALGRVWHPACFRCRQCGGVISGGPFLEDGDAPCHVACWHALHSPPCAICRGPIQTPRHFTDGWGNAYCETHQNQFPPCSSCGRLACSTLTDGGVRYGDGRVMCNLCRVRAVERVEEGSAALGEVRRLLAREGMDLGGESLPLALVDRLILARRASGLGAGQDLEGLARTRVATRGGREVGREVEEILILHGLPRDHFAQVAAHELCHAWLFLNRFPPLPAVVEEGLASLAEWLWLRDQEGERARFRMRRLLAREDPVYGKGLRQAHRAWQTMGMATLLDQVRRQGRFPGSAPWERFSQWLVGAPRGDGGGG